MAKKKTAKPASKSRKTLSPWVKIPLWVLLVLSVLLLAFENKKYLRRAYRHFVHRYQKTNWRPTDFPASYDIHGIDVSHYQEEIDWKKLQAIDSYGDTIQFRFAYIKATEGLLTEDALFDEYWEDAKEAGVYRGAYHYFLPDRSAALQATNFITSVKLRKGDLPPVVDIEETRGKKKADIVKGLKEMLLKLEAHYRVKPVIYSNINFIEDYLSEDFSGYSFWIAHYYQEEIKPDENIRWLFWQHSDQADLRGIKGAVDANVFNGDAYDLEKLLLR